MGVIFFHTDRKSHLVNIPPTASLLNYFTPYAPLSLKHYELRYVMMNHLVETHKDLINLELHLGESAYANRKAGHIDINSRSELGLIAERTECWF